MAPEAGGVQKTLILVGLAASGERSVGGLAPVMKCSGNECMIFLLAHYKNYFATTVAKQWYCTATYTVHLDGPTSWYAFQIPSNIK